MKLNYELFSHGWALASIHVDGQDIKLRVSYLSDALQDMAYAAVAVRKGGDEVRFSFMEEPGEYRWIIRSKSEGRVEVTILEFADDFPSPFPDEQGKVMICFETTRNRFCGEVLSVMNGLMNRMTLDEYKDQWGSDFPSEKYEELKRLLKGSSPKESYLSP